MTEEVLREIVSAIGQIDPAQITSATPLTGPLGGSLGRARLDAALRSKLGQSNAGVYKSATFGDLCGLFSVIPISGAAVITPRASQLKSIVETNAVGNSLQIGIDVESIAALPNAQDYWEHEFYKTTFTHGEIAYALMQPSPRASFAGMWCAKEALRKANAALANVEWLRLEVIHDSGGKPYLAADGQPLGGALSVSHTDEIAFAAYTAGTFAHQATPTGFAPQYPPEPFPTPLARGGKVPIVLALFALMFAISAIAISIFHR